MDSIARSFFLNNLFFNFQSTSSKVNSSIPSANTSGLKWIEKRITKFYLELYRSSLGKKYLKLFMNEMTVDTQLTYKTRNVPSLASSAFSLFKNYGIFQNYAEVRTQRTGVSVIVDDQGCS